MCVCVWFGGIPLLALWHLIATMLLLFAAVDGKLSLF